VPEAAGEHLHGFERPEGAVSAPYDGTRTEEEMAVRIVEALDEHGVELNEWAEATLAPASPRRTSAEMMRLRTEILLVLNAHHPQSVRGVFYQLVARGLPKEEAQYRAVQREVLRMRRGQDRRSGNLVLPALPYGWIADGSRWMRRPDTYSGLRALFEDLASSYRRDLWQAQDVYMEVWVEKDALADVIYTVTSEWQVPLMVSRGFSSETFLAQAADAMKSTAKPSFVYVFTDGDKAGDRIYRQIRQGLHRLAPDADIECVRAAVTAEQIRELRLPTRPEKTGRGTAVELDAIPANELQRIVRECIVKHVDRDSLNRVVLAQQAEQETLERIVERFGDAA